MKFVASLFAVASVALLGSCASVDPAGAIYTGVTRPIAANNNVPATKVGTASSHSYFYLIATGDASIEAAKANGGIKNVSTVDYETTNVLGIFGTYTTIVKGN